MKIAIVGAGIIGVTTAWELAVDGHEVIVFERRGAAAEESSFANAGVVAPGYVTPWAGPGMRGKVLRSLLSTHGAIKLRWPLSRARPVAGWRAGSAPASSKPTWPTARACSAWPSTAARGCTRSPRRCELEYDRSDGYLVLLRSKRETASWCRPACEVLRAAGSSFREVDADEARKIEPALNADTPLAGAIHLPDDEVGNCRQFALLLKWEAEALGAQFHFNCDLAPLEPRRADRARRWRAAREAPSLRRGGGVRRRGLGRRCCGRWACAFRWRRSTAIRSAPTSANRSTRRAAR